VKGEIPLNLRIVSQRSIKNWFFTDCILRKWAGVSLCTMGQILIDGIFGHLHNSRGYNACFRSISSYITDKMLDLDSAKISSKSMKAKSPTDERKIKNNMNRKTTFPIALMLFVLLWGAFGFVAGPTQAQSASFQATPVDTPAVGVTVVAPVVVTQLVPVTGTTDPSPLMWIFFGLIALLGVVFLVALLAGSGAHRHDVPPPPP
jgi:hypothetical protein